MAVARTSGTLTFATFSYSLVGHIAHARTPDDAALRTVPSVSLDDAVYRMGHTAPVFLKIDVEGAEDQVLLGAERVLREHRPVIVAEVRRALWPDISRLMGSLGYRWHPLVAGSGAAQTGMTDVLFRPDA